MKTYIAFLMALFVLTMISAPVSAKYNSNTFVRAAHLSPDAPAVDILANDNVLFSGATFQAVTDFEKVPAGKYNIKVVPTGATQPVVIEADLELKRNKFYSILAVNTLNSIEPIVITDNLRFISPKQSYVRFVHASPDAPAVDIAVSNGPVLFSNVQFKDVEKYLKVSPGKYDLEVRLAGTDTVVLEVPGVKLQKGTSYTVFATGIVSQGTLNAVLVEDRESKLKYYFNKHR